MTVTSDPFKDIVPSPAQNWNQMVPAVSIEESHENRNVFIGVLSLGRIFGDRRQRFPGANPTLQERASLPLQSGTKWNYLEPLESHDAQPPQNPYPSPVARGSNPKGKPR
jgi:hypothetical protein